MLQKTTNGLTLLFLATLSGASQAQTVIDNGGVNTISGPSGPIAVEGNGTTVNVVSPAVVTGTGGIQFGEAIRGDAGTAINVMGGSITGGVDPTFSGAGVHTSGAFSAFGGSVSGVEAGVLIEAGGTALLGGGTFRGDDVSVGSGGAGLLFLSFQTDSSSVQILGGTFQGGDSLHITGGVGAGIDGNFDIGGGTFRGGIGGAGGAVGAALNVGGHGTTQSGSISGGTFVPGEAIDYVAIFNVGSSSTLSVSGGTFSGGLFATLGDDSSTLDFFGRNLNWTQQTGAFGSYDGMLTGTLSDGTPLDLELDLRIPTSQPGSYLGVFLTRNPQGEELMFQAARLQSHRRSCCSA